MTERRDVLSRSLVMLVASIAVVASTATAGEIKITGIDVGFDGAYRTAVWTPVEVSLQTQVVPFSGEVGITEDGVTEFRVAVALRAGATGRVRIPAILKRQVSRLTASAYVASLETPVFAAELTVPATHVPPGTLMFLADEDIPQPRLAEMKTALAKEIGGDVAAQIRICRVPLAEFPRRLEYYESFDGLILSERAQAAVASDRALAVVIEEYRRLMGIILPLHAGQLPSKIPRRREMLSFPYRYRISEETSALFEPQRWAPRVRDVVVFNASFAVLALAIVVLIVVRSPHRAARRTTQQLSWPARLVRAVLSFLPALAGMACAAALAGWGIARSIQTCRRVEFRFSTTPFCSGCEEDVFFLVEGHGRDCAVSQAQGENWLAPCAQRNASARALVVLFDADGRQKFFVPNARPGDSMLLATKRFRTCVREGDEQCDEVPRLLADGVEDGLAALEMFLMRDPESVRTEYGYMTNGYFTWRLKDVYSHLDDMPADTWPSVRLRDLKATLPQLSLSTLAGEWYAGDTTHRMMARQLDFWRRVTARKERSALLLFRQSKPGDAGYRTAPFILPPEDAPPADVMWIVLP